MGIFTKVFGDFFQTEPAKSPARKPGRGRGRSARERQALRRERFLDQAEKSPDPEMRRKYDELMWRSVDPTMVKAGGLDEELATLEKYERMRRRLAGKDDDEPSLLKELAPIAGLALAQFAAARAGQPLGMAPGMPMPAGYLPPGYPGVPGMPPVHVHAPQPPAPIPGRPADQDLDPEEEEGEMISLFLKARFGPLTAADAATVLLTDPMFASIRPVIEACCQAPDGLVFETLEQEAAGIPGSRPIVDYLRSRDDGQWALALVRELRARTGLPQAG